MLMCHCATDEVEGKSRNDHERVLSVAVSNGTGKVIFYKQHQQRSNPFPMM